MTKVATVLALFQIGCFLDKSRRTLPHLLDEEVTSPSQDMTESESQRNRFWNLMLDEIRDVEEIFSALPEYDMSPMHIIFRNLKEIHGSKYYSLACLTNAAEYLDETNWMGVYSKTLLKRARDTSVQGHELDKIFTYNEKGLKAVYGSFSQVWSQFVVLVAVLEWKRHPRGIRDAIQDVYRSLLGSRVASPADLINFKEILTSLAPSEETTEDIDILHARITALRWRLNGVHAL